MTIRNYRRNTPLYEGDETSVDPFYRDGRNHGGKRKDDRTHKFCHSCGESLPFGFQSRIGVHNRCLYPSANDRILIKQVRYTSSRDA